MKIENRKLLRQLRDAENSGGSSTGGGAKSTGKNITKRELAALSVEHEMLTAQVSDMKRFL